MFITDDTIKWVEHEFKPNQIFQSCSVICKRKVFDNVDVSWGNMEWRDLAFQIYINNFNVYFSSDCYYKIIKSENSTGAHSLKRYEVSLENAKKYFFQSKGQIENEVFRSYLANRHKAVANYCFKRGRFLKSFSHLFHSFGVERKISNLVPFADF